MSIEKQIFTFVAFAPAGRTRVYLSLWARFKKAAITSMMSAEKVVAIGMKAVFGGKMTVITGFINFLALPNWSNTSGKCGLWVGRQAMKNSVEYKRANKVF